MLRVSTIATAMLLVTSSWAVAAPRSAPLTATAEETSVQAGVVSAASVQVSTNVQTVAAATEECRAAVAELLAQETVPVQRMTTRRDVA